MPPPTDHAWEELLLHHKYHAAVRRVARGVAHSYNNIFTGLGGQVTILRQEAGLPASGDNKRGGLIQELVQRGVEQTTILYNFTRDEPGESGPQSPLHLAGKALELLNTISRLHRFRLRCQTQGKKIAVRVREVVLILFYLGENCVDATPEGGEILLTIDTDEKRRVRFTFRDQGPGFAPEQQAAIGRPFNSSRGGQPGRGLGLYAATLLAGRCAGTLDVRREEQATLVSAAFPALVEEQATVAPATAGPRQAGPTTVRQCFLVVEDDEAMRTLLLNRLQRRGHMVFCVDTCAEAVEEFQHLHDIITIVLMDVGLRDDSGYECQRRLAAIAPGVRVIFMSGEHEPPRQAAPENLVFLQKPFSMDQLEQAIVDVHL